MSHGFDRLMATHTSMRVHRDGWFFPQMQNQSSIKKNGISFVDKFNCLMASFELGIIYYTAL